MKFLSPIQGWKKLSKETRRLIRKHIKQGKPIIGSMAWNELELKHKKQKRRR
jgi:hypothetical protein